MTHSVGDRGSHTPGEWLTDCNTDGRAYGVSANNAGGYRVPVVVWRGIAKPASPEGQANARLIAAAPALLEALEPFGEIDGEGDEDFPDDTKVTVKFGRTTDYTLTLGDFRRARAAIQSATGEG